MRGLIRWGLSLIVVLDASGWALAADMPRDVIEKAIKAHGGAEKLGKLNHVHVRGKGTIEVNDNASAFDMERLISMPDRERIEISIDVGGNKIAMTRIFDGTKGWVVLAGQAVDVEDEELAEMKDAAYANRVITLTPLLTKDFTLESLKESEVDNQAAVGVRVKSTGRKNVDLYFSKESGLLVRVDREGLNPVNREKGTQHIYLSEYKDFDGVKQATRMKIMYGKSKFMDAEMTELKFVDKFDPKEFMKP